MQCSLRFNSFCETYADLFLHPLLGIYKEMQHSYVIELKYAKGRVPRERVEQLRQEAIEQALRHPLPIRCRRPSATPRYTVSSWYSMAWGWPSVKRYSGRRTTQNHSAALRLRARQPCFFHSSTVPSGGQRLADAHEVHPVGVNIRLQRLPKDGMLRGCAKSTRLHEACVYLPTPPMP